MPATQLCPDGHFTPAHGLPVGTHEARQVVPLDHRAPGRAVHREEGRTVADLPASVLEAYTRHHKGHYYLLAWFFLSRSSDKARRLPYV